MTHGMDQSHFASPVLDKFYSELTQLGHRCSIHRVHPNEIRSLRLPPSFSKERTSGILCLEMLNAEYDQMLCGLGIPVLFIDSPLIGLAQYIQADLILMENRGSIYLFVEEMIKRGKKKIGFIGEYRHSLIFCQRYLGFRDAMYMYGLPINEDFCILGNKETGKPETPSPEEYQEYLMEQLRSRNELPEVFLCANDFVALCVLQCFKRLGISCPQDVYLCGFDDAPESRILTPTLTTIHTHSQIMAVTAAQLLLSRIKMPSLNYRIVHTETTLIYRESTGD
jgi:LacI family transcriptional regulator